MALQKISQSTYKGLCLKIGTQEQVCFRRDFVDIAELLSTPKGINGTGIKTGSWREGFRLKGSDIDCINWEENARVIWNKFQWQVDSFHEYTVVLCDCSKSPPGYVLLQMILLHHPFLLSACIGYEHALLFSSTKYRALRGSTLHGQNFIMHGPCYRLEEGGVKYDLAFGLSSDHWPPPALGWIDRCQAWPPSTVVADIVRSGCHFVSIGSKVGNHTDNEWRISFSKAEQKLVYAMNHTQFLTYGLLKLFLKEVINKEIKEENTVLSSYHMKTAIFWVIQQNTIPNWNPQNLLEGFWICFKLLLKWIYKGVCPNFFIPENNLFLEKMHSEAQYTTFNRLYDLYEKGIMVILECPSIGSYIYDSFVFDPRLSLSTEHMMISEAAFDEELFQEINNSVLYPHKLKPTEYIERVEKLLRFPLSQYKILMLQRLTVRILQITVFHFNSKRTDALNVNKQMYILDKMYCNMLKIAAKFGFISDMLYIAMYFYITCRYKEAICIINATKVKLREPGLFYLKILDQEGYIEAVSGQSWSIKMREAAAADVRLHKNILYIPELTPEQVYSSKNGRHFLSIPPVVLLHMLEFLCYNQMDAVKARTALQNLEDVVFMDDRIPLFISDISLSILGICYLMSGNPWPAILCYIQSLKQYHRNGIHEITAMRMLGIIYRIMKNLSALSLPELHKLLEKCLQYMINAL